MAESKVNSLERGGALSRCGREVGREREPEDDDVTCGREGETERA